MFLSSGGAGSAFSAITYAAQKKGYKLYLFIDEYDNFTNDLVRLCDIDPSDGSVRNECRM